MEGTGATLLIRPGENTVTDKVFIFSLVTVWRGAWHGHALPLGVNLKGPFCK